MSDLIEQTKAALASHKKQSWERSGEPTDLERMAVQIARALIAADEVARYLDLALSGRDATAEEMQAAREALAAYRVLTKEACRE